MKRVILVLAVSLLMLVPLASASADSCPDVEGRAILMWGHEPQTGTAHLTYDGHRMKVDFLETGNLQFGDGTSEVYFEWYFPTGTVEITEYSTASPSSGPNVLFYSTLVVTSGGTGDWTWSGKSNNRAGIARIQTLEGTLCIGS